MDSLSRDSVRNDVNVLDLSPYYIAFHKKSKSEDSS